MSVGGVGGANDMMMRLVQILMQGMQEQVDLSQKMLAANVEIAASVDQMAIAQNIIDVYA